MPRLNKPVIIITGASGNIGGALCDRLKQDYTVIGLDIENCPQSDISFECDLTSDDSVHEALESVCNEVGNSIAAVIHLAAYFDFSGDEHPMYEKVNIMGTQRLLKMLQSFEVDRFIYSSTMLVQEAVKPGQKIDESGSINPKWAYPQSKADAENIIRQNHKKIPYTILRLAGLYDDMTGVPTLAHQIARIYEKDIHSYAYSGDVNAGQACIHQEDMVEVFVQVVEKRKELPIEDVILAGEEQVLSYKELQDTIGRLIHGNDNWLTINIPKPIAKMGAWVEEKAEPVIPDAIDKGEEPFIKPFMIDLASDHYALDIARAKNQLNWRPRHKISEGLKTLIENLKADPENWYKKNKIPLPHSLK